MKAELRLTIARNNSEEVIELTRIIEIPFVPAPGTKLFLGDSSFTPEYISYDVTSGWLKLLQFVSLFDEMPFEIDKLLAKGWGRADDQTDH